MFNKAPTIIPITAGFISFLLAFVKSLSHSQKPIAQTISVVIKSIKEHISNTVKTVLSPSSICAK